MRVILVKKLYKLFVLKFNNFMNLKQFYRLKTILLSKINSTQ